MSAAGIAAASHQFGSLAAGQAPKRSRVGSSTVRLASETAGAWGRQSALRRSRYSAHERGAKARSAGESAGVSGADCAPAGGGRAAARAIRKVITGREDT